MKKVEIYDQYSPVYRNPSNQLVTPALLPGQSVESNLTLVHPSSGFVTVVQENLDEQAAKQKVQELYEESKALGTSYTNKIVNLDNSYAELTIQFADGKFLNRVIYVANY